MRKKIFLNYGTYDSWEYVAQVLSENWKKKLFSLDDAVDVHKWAV